MKSVLIIGMGHMGRHLASKLQALGNEVMIVDKNPDVITALSDRFTDSNICDCTNESIIEALGVDNFDICFVTIGGNFQNSLETTSLIKELGAACVVSRAEQDVQAKFLLRNGADHVVYPEKQTAKWAAIRNSTDLVFDYIKLDEQHAILDVEVPKTWVGKSIGALDIRRKFGVNILGIKRDGKTDVSVTPETILTKDISVLALGEYKALRKCFHL